MSEPGGPLVDGDARERAARDIGRSCCMEAGAGTGKTTLLVDRYVSIITGGAAGCREVVAITFTEKAALEMKERIRRRLEGLASGGASSPDILSRVEAALAEIENAPVSTIHSFASSILREYPVEAGIDPRFTQLDEIESSIMLDDCWNAFLQGLEAPFDGVIRGWFDAGGGLAALRDAAMKVYSLRGRGRVGELPGGDRPGDPEGSGGEYSGLSLGPAALGDMAAYGAFLEASSAELAALLESSGLDRGDEGAFTIAGFLDSLRAAPGPGEEGREEYLLGMEIPKAKGNRKNWDPQDACARQKSIFREISERRGNLRKLRADRLRGGLMRWLGRFTAAVEETKRREGVLDFDDLLIKARLLLEDPFVLRSLRRRYTHILVDEFQDTDSRPAGIIMLLSGPGGGEGPKDEGPKDEGSAGEGPPGEGSIGEGTAGAGPGPGNLFIVGDPKQSIYRFRNADVEIYEKVKMSFGGDESRLKITQNFRSVPGITEWVNGAFSKIMTGPEEGLYQPRYEPIHARREGGGAAVVSLRFERDGERAGEIRRAESAAVAGYIRELVAGGREIMDPVSRAMRPVRFGDIAVIYRGTTGIEYYEDSLRFAAIQYIVEGGKLYYTRQEVRDLASALWAIEDPYDSAALVASLRSGLFGFSDEELFLFKRDGGSFNYLEPRLPAGGGYADMAEAFGLLKDLHFARNSLGPAGIFKRLLRMTRYLELSVTRPHGAQRARNIRKAVRSAREFSGRLHSYRYFARWFRDQERLSAAEGESPAIDEDENAVRMLTIHKSKGLQFPVVILVNLFQKFGRSEKFISASGGALAFNLGGGWETSDYAEALAGEKMKDLAETARLLYVAATRAGDLLVIPAAGGEGTYYGMLSPFIEEAGPAGDGRRAGGPGSVLVVNAPKGEADYPGEGRGEGADDGGMTAGKLSEALARWRRDRDAVISRAKEAPARIRPSDFGDFRPAAPDEAGPAPASSGAPGKDQDEAMRFGSAFHRVMELADLGNAESAGPLVAEAALMFGIEGREEELLSLVRSALSSPIVAAAASSGNCRREMAFSVPFPGGMNAAECGGAGPAAMVEGRIDLLYEKDGAWTVVDYKTDDIPPGLVGERTAVYEKQGALYAWALKAAGIDLSGGVVFLFVRPGAAGRLEITPEILAATARMIQAEPEPR
jgi:ATP-dependent exoDNAse (exonuclease V) beta subunit